jgi:hypothetical protein
MEGPQVTPAVLAAAFMWCISAWGMFLCMFIKKIKFMCALGLQNTSSTSTGHWALLVHVFLRTLETCGSTFWLSGGLVGRFGVFDPV